MDVYIVNSYYHILIALAKVFIDKKDSKLIIFNDKSKNSISLNKNMINKIIKKNVFRQVEVVENPFNVSFENKNIRFYLKKILFTKFFYKKFTNLIGKEDNIYIFNDTSDLGQILNSKKVSYVLIEDGRDCFKNNSLIINQKKTLKNIMKKLFFGTYQMGSSKYIKYIEVNDSKNLQVFNKKLVECNRDKMFSELTSNDIDCLLEIFDIKSIIDKLGGTYNLLITQPLYKDGLLSDETEQLLMYKKIINKYLGNNKTIIKMHPREENIYSGLVNIEVIDKQFPVELLNYVKTISFHTVATISSTSIDSIINCKSKKILSWKWLSNYKNGDYNE